MLCQRCNAKEAMVHFSIVAWPSSCETKHVCESCSNLEPIRIVGRESMIAQGKPTAGRATLRTRLRRKYVRYLFAGALDLAARSIRDSTAPSIRRRVRRNLAATQFLVLRRLSSIIGLQGKLTVFFREAKGAPATFRPP
jgi:hypothetical protein